MKKADDWAVPVVNHLWLEDCFAQWRDIAPTLDRYTTFPPGVNFGELLAEDGGRVVLGMVAGMSGGSRVGYDQTELDRMEREIETEADALPPGKTNDVRSEVRETPKRGILKKSKGAKEDAAATTRRLVAERKRRASESGVDDAAEASTGVYVDMDVVLDDDGRLSISGSELGFDHGRGDEEENLGADETRGRAKSKQGRKSQARPSTPTRGRDRPSSGGSKLPSTPIRTKPPSTPKSKAMSGVQARASRQETRADPVPPPEDAEDQDDVGEPLTPIRPASRKAAMKGKAKTKFDTMGGDDEDGDIFDVGASARKGTVIKTYRAKSRSRSRSHSRPPVRDEDDYEPKVKARTTTTKGKSKAVADEDDDEPPVKKTPLRTAKTSAKRRLEVPSDSETEEEPPKVKPRSGRRTSDREDDDIDELTTSPRRAGTPRRRASVVLPTLKEVLSASQQNAPQSQSQSQAEAPAEKPTSSRSKGAPDKSPAKRGRPPTSSRSAKPGTTKPALPERTPSSSPAPVPKPKRGRPSAAAAAAARAEAGPSHVETADASPVKAYGRRSAAAKAAQRLHEIMPDANSFAKELKSGHVRGYEEAAKEKGKEKEGPRGRKRPSLGDGEEGSDGERDAKKRRTEVGPVAMKGKGRKSNVPPPDEEDEVVEVPKKLGRPTVKVKAKPEPSVRCVYPFLDVYSRLTL